MIKPGKSTRTIIEEVVAYTSPLEIFERFTGYQIISSKRYKSPLREDNNPSVSFQNLDGWVIMYDFSKNFSCDCIGLVQSLKGFSSRRAAALYLHKTLGHKETTKRSYAFDKEPVTIECQQRDLEEKDLLFWSKVGISQETLLYFNVTPLLYYTIVTSTVHNRQYISKFNLCYRYPIQDKCKLYMPKSRYKFIGNAPAYYLQGYEFLPEKGELVVITKSFKDVMLLYEIGIPAVAPGSENVLLKDVTVESLKERFNRVVLLFDFDYTGVCGANKNRKKHGLEYRFLTNGRFGTFNYQAKDPTDLYQLIGKESFHTLKKLLK